MTTRTAARAELDDRSATQQRVADLRRQAETDAAAARNLAWAWFEDLGRDARRDYSPAAIAAMDDLFAEGTVPTRIAGPQDGLILTWGADKRQVTLFNPTLRATVPWVGKTFEPDTNTGFQRLTGWRKYLTPWVLAVAINALIREHGRPGPFTTRVEPGAIEPAPDVLVLDYNLPESLPPARKVRDELVEIVPGAYFGRALSRTRAGWTVAAYFALRQP
ncbi:MAG TPA: hypothetical protein VF426_00315 [Marmoricola sp.]